MPPSDPVALKELAAMRGEMAKTADLMKAMIQQANELNKFLAERLERIKSKT